MPKLIVTHFPSMRHFVGLGRVTKADQELLKGMPNLPIPEWVGKIPNPHARPIGYVVEQRPGVSHYAYYLTLRFATAKIERALLVGSHRRLALGEAPPIIIQALPISEHLFSKREMGADCVFVHTGEIIQLNETHLSDLQAATVQLSSAHEAVRWWFGVPRQVNPLTTGDSVAQKKKMSREETELRDDLVKKLLNFFASSKLLEGIPAPLRIEDLVMLAASSIAKRRREGLEFLSRLEWFPATAINELEAYHASTTFIEAFGIALASVIWDYLGVGFTPKQIELAVEKLIPRPFVTALELVGREHSKEHDFTSADAWAYASRNYKDPEGGAKRALDTAYQLKSFDVRKYYREKGKPFGEEDIVALNESDRWYFAHHHPSNPRGALEAALDMTLEMKSLPIHLGDRWYFAKHYGSQAIPAAKAALTAAERISEEIDVRAFYDEKGCTVPMGEEVILSDSDRWRFAKFRSEDPIQAVKSALAMEYHLRSFSASGFYRQQGYVVPPDQQVTLTLFDRWYFAKHYGNKAESALKEALNQEYQLRNLDVRGIYQKYDLEVTVGEEVIISPTHRWFFALQYGTNAQDALERAIVAEYKLRQTGVNSSMTDRLSCAIQNPDAPEEAFAALFR